MKSTTLLLSTLAATAFAQPHRHAHADLHKKHAIEKRDSTVVWVTDWDYVTETIPVTKTIWVSSGFVAPASTSTAAANFFETTSVPAPKPASPTSTSSVYVAPPAPTVATYVPPTTSTPEPVVAPAPVAEAPSPTTTPVVEAPSPTTTPVTEAPSPPTTTTTTPVAVEGTPTYVAPVESSSPPAAVYTPPAPVYTAPAPEPTTAAPAPAVTTPTSSGSSSGECSSGSTCKGDITYYDAGLGACGWTNDSSENVVALPHGLMGAQSNGNPYCGKTITVKYGGKTVTAKVVDKCMGCVGYDIDLSNAAFDGLANEAVGRTKAEWWFN